MHTETLSDFARRLDVSQPLVSRWKKQGRLVMDGPRVVVEPSIELLERTKGDRDDLSRLHRAKKDLDRDLAEAPAPESLRDELRQVQLERARNEARIKAADADTKEMERDKLAGVLVHVEDVDYVLQDFGALLRAMIDGRAERIGAELGLTPDQIGGLAESDEQMLGEMAEKLKRRDMV
jgi:phage terminase Nu1 subunit (DNA packaging protein)